MIYFIYGNETSKINNYIRKIYGENIPNYFASDNITESELLNYASGANLFGNFEIVIVDDFIKNFGKDLSDDFWNILNKTANIFIFREDKLLTPEIKKLGKFGEIKEFSSKTIKTIPKFNAFSIADSFAKRDKIHTWTLYNEAISSDISPEELSGIIFWKIKMMAITGSKIFSKKELKKMSSELVSLYHRAHMGEVDFVIGLEQFILNSLNK